MTAVFRHLFLIEAGDLTTIQHNFSGSQCIHSTKDVQKGGLTRAGWANNDHKFSLLNLKAHVMERLNLHFARTVSLSHIMKLNESHGIHPCFFHFHHYSIYGSGN